MATFSHKKVRIEFHARRDAALAVLDRLDQELDGNVERLANKDLEVLLRWKGALPSKMGNMANKRALSFSPGTPKIIV